MHQFSVITDAPLMTKGFVKELRLRWFFEEIGEPYQEMRYKHSELKKAPYLELQPFGQVPAYKNGECEMFETGAILLFLADEKGRLFPQEGVKRAKALSYLFALLNTLEPFIIMRSWLKFSFDQENKLIQEVLNKGLNTISEKLTGLERVIKNKEFMLEEFSIIDILFTTILRNITSTNIFEKHPSLLKYLSNMEKRPSFIKAQNDHFKLYE